MDAKHIIATVSSQIGMHPEAGLRLAAKKLAAGMKIAQHSDTLMLYHILGHDSCHVHFVTADSPINLASSMIYFKKMLKENGIHTIYTNSESNRTKQAMAHVGMHLEHSDRPQYKYMARVV